MESEYKMESEDEIKKEPDPDSNPDNYKDWGKMEMCCGICHRRRRAREREPIYQCFLPCLCCRCTYTNGGIDCCEAVFCCRGVGDIVSPLLSCNKNLGVDRFSLLWCQCHCDSTEALPGKSKSKDVNEYILKNKLRTQKHRRYFNTFGTYTKELGPPQQKMSNKEVEEMLTEVSLQTKLDKYPTADVPNLTNLVTDYM